MSILKPTRVESQDGTAVPRAEMLQVRSASANKGRGLDPRMQTQGIAKRYMVSIFRKTAVADCKQSKY